MRLGGRLHRIGADQLRLNHTELSIYVRKCGVALTDRQMDALLRSSEGWFSAIYLSLCSFAERGVLSDENSDIYQMFTSALIDPLAEDEQEFLAMMSLADEFTAEMARRDHGAGRRGNNAHGPDRAERLCHPPAGQRRLSLPPHDENLRRARVFPSEF